MTDLASGGVSRRTFLSRSAGAAAALAAASQFELLGARAVSAAPRSPGAGYGPLQPAIDRTTGLPLIKLPAGFEYRTFGWRGDLMADGKPTPSAHDGMAAFRRGRHVLIVRNHEQGGTTGAFAEGMTYDPQATGGTTTLAFDPRSGELVTSWPSLAGTIRNCAGGPTPWGSWLSCEETTLINREYRHGYVFEVPADGASDGVPIKGMGRFSHEAAATDPRTSIVYLTEDATPSGLYRYVPDRHRNLAAGGKLQMLKIGSQTVQTYEDASPTDYGRVTWVDIPVPDPGPDETSTVEQGIAAGGAQFDRLEGIWCFDDRIYFVSTSGGPERGQVFELDLKDDRLRLVFHSPSLDVLDSPDNICLSPRGGMVLCEDGSGTEYLHGLTRDGQIFRFAENTAVLDGERNGITGDFTGSEWCGATFDPKGEWLFANLQSPGITFAITGPWAGGGL
jgi:secreted PhoX family phosphatase